MAKKKIKSPGGPTEIVIEPFAEKGRLCMGRSACPKGVRFKITYQHRHRGRIKKAVRLRCEHHMRRFAQRHNVKLAA